MAVLKVEQTVLSWARSLVDEKAEHSERWTVGSMAFPTAENWDNSKVAQTVAWWADCWEWPWVAHLALNLAERLEKNWVDMKAFLKAECSELRRVAMTALLSAEYWVSQMVGSKAE